MSAVNEELRETNSVKSRKLKSVPEERRETDLICLSASACWGWRPRQHSNSRGQWLHLVFYPPVCLHLWLFFLLSFQPTHSFKSQKVGQVRKLAWSNLGVVLCLAVKSNARNCELSLLRLFFLLLKFRDVQLTPSTLQNRAGKWIKGGEVVWCKNIIWLDTLQLMLNLLLHSVNKCGRGGCYRREWLWEHMSHFPVTLSHADDFL